MDLELVSKDKENWLEKIKQLKREKQELQTR